MSILIFLVVTMLARAGSTTRPFALHAPMHLYRYTQPVEAPNSEQQEAVLSAILSFNDENNDDSSHYTVFHPVQSLSFAYYHQARRELAVPEGSLLPMYGEFYSNTKPADVMESDSNQCSIAQSLMTTLARIIGVDPTPQPMPRNNHAVLADLHKFIGKALDLLVHKADSYWTKWVQLNFRPTNNYRLMYFMKRWLLLASSMSTIIHCFRWSPILINHRKELEAITMFQTLFMMTSFQTLFSRVTPSRIHRFNLAETLVWIYLYEQLVFWDFGFEGHPVGDMLQIQCAIIQPNLNLHSSPKHDRNMLSVMDTLWLMMCDCPSIYTMPKLQPVDKGDSIDVVVGTSPSSPSPENDNLVDRDAQDVTELSPCPPSTIGVDVDRVNVPSCHDIDLPAMISDCAVRGMQHDPERPESRHYDTPCFFCMNDWDANYSQVLQSMETVAIAPFYFRRCGRPIHVGCGRSDPSFLDCCWHICAHKFSLLVRDGDLAEKALSHFHFKVSQIHISRDGDQYMLTIDPHPRRR